MCEDDEEAITDAEIDYLSEIEESIGLGIDCDHYALQSSIFLDY